MAVVNGTSAFGKALCKALGLEGQKVRSIDLHVHYDDAVSADVTFLVVDSQADEILDVVKHYQLVEKQE